jgi:predicted dienelactone hydrolase
MTWTAGWCTVRVRDDATATTYPAVVAYPSEATEHPLRVGPYEIDVAADAPVATGAFPVVAISHGSGGSPLTHRGLALHLARRGFVVVAPEHAGNNRSDNALANAVANLAQRPRHVSLAVDRALAELEGAAVGGALAVVGHSIGGYTALAMAGARPWARPDGRPDAAPMPVPVTPDPRVRALVLLAPATPWLAAPGALDDVRAPILMLTGGRDTSTPAVHAGIVARGLPRTTRLEHRVVPDAGHYAFLAPFPPAMRAPAFAPAHDPPGFDRARFHDAMYAELETFLRRTLTEETA